MAFVSEEIRQEDKEYFNSIGFTMLGSNAYVRPYWWVIDRAREIIVTCRGGVREEATVGYEIYMNNQFIDIELIQKRKRFAFE